MHQTHLQPGADSAFPDPLDGFMEEGRRERKREFSHFLVYNLTSNKIKTTFFKSFVKFFCVKYKLTKYRSKSSFARTKTTFTIKGPDTP